MARTKQEVEVSKASNSLPTLGEIGNLGIAVFNGISVEEIKRDLNHPMAINTYRLMSMHPAVNAPLSLFDNMVASATFRFIPPKDATKKEIKQAAIIESMFYDMDESLDDFIHEAMTATRYGWSVLEKVFRKRTYEEGSKYNDGLIGLKKLPLRNQRSLKRFIFDDSGNNVIAVVQNLSGLIDPYQQFLNRDVLDIIIPRNKFLLINFGDNRSNPFGTSPLRNVYVPWKYLQALEELEAQSISKDVNGLPILTVPVQYLAADASDEQKALLETFKNMMRNLQQGSQSGMIIPSVYDPETKQPLFKLDLLTQDGKRNNDLNKIKEYYRTMIFIGLGADILLMGATAGNSGSFALGSIKNSLTGNVAEGFIRRIVQVVNDDLIKDLYLLNGWDISRRCRFDYEGFDQESLDEIGKYGQRLASVGMLTKDLDTINYFRTGLGLDPFPEGTDITKLLTPNTSRAGEGMATPGDGTSTNSISDTSSLNMDNAA